MAPPPRINLSDADKDRLLIEQGAMIERLAARIAELEAALPAAKDVIQFAPAAFKGWPQ